MYREWVDDVQTAISGQVVELFGVVWLLCTGVKVGQVINVNER